MKIFKRIIWGLVIFLAVFYAIPAGLVQTPFFQKKISLVISDYLEEKLHTEVNIGRIEIELFNKLILKNVYLEDQSGDTLFQAKRIAAGFELLPMFHNKWRFDSAQIFTFQFNLNKETDDSPLNIQYIIDTFAKSDTIQTNNPIELRISHLNLHAGNFSYRVKNAPETPGKFNAKAILLNNVSSKIHIDHFKDNELSVEVHKLGFEEQSGFRVKKLSFDLTADTEKAIIQKLKVNLDKSSLQISDILADYSGEKSGKNKIENTKIQLKLEDSDIFLNELSAFIPAFSRFEDKISMEGDFSGKLNDLTIQNLYFRYYNQLMIKTNAHFKNLLDSNSDAIFIDGAIAESFFSPEGIERIVNNFSKKPFVLPAQIRQMQNLRFNGEVKGFTHNLAASGTLDTGIGTILAHVAIGRNGTRFIKGEIASNSLNLEQLINNKDLGEAIFNVQFDAKQNPDKKFSGTVDANIDKFVYKGYAYNHFNLSGEFSPTNFKGLINLDSPEGKIAGEGFFVLDGINSELKFAATASLLQLGKLNLSQKYKNSTLSFEVNAHFVGNNPDNLLGAISLKDLHFESEKGNFHLDSLSITAAQTGQEKTLSIQSEIIRGEICGVYNFSALVPEIKQTVSLYLPALFNNPGDAKAISLPDKTQNGKSFDGKENHFSIDLTIEDMTEISHIFNLPFSLTEKTKITGQYNNVYDSFNLKADIPQATIGGSRLQSTQILLDNSKESARLDIQGISLQKKEVQLKFAIQMNAENDLINSSLNWGSNAAKYKGDIELTTSFSRGKGKSPLRTMINVRQSDLIFNDSIWSLHPSTILIDSANVKINRFQATHAEQYIKINGAVSHNPNEEIQVELKKVDLEYIFQSLNIKALEFGGIASGFVNASDVYNTRKLSTQLDVKDFTFNNTVFGDLDLIGKWNDEDQGVQMDGLVYKNDSTYVKVDGIIFPVKEVISIDFNAKNTDARFLRKYLNKVAKNVTGHLSGHLRLFGNLNKPTIEGDVLAKNCRFGVEYLNTYYTFSDSVKCLPDEIQIKNLSLQDEKGNVALANGYVKHRLFDDFRFLAHISYDNFMVFNATRVLNPLFFGTAYGSGTATLSGTEDVVNIDVSMQNTENTKMTMNFMEESDIVDYDFIHFVSNKKDTIPNKTVARASNSTPQNTNQGTEIRFNLLLNATPQATIEIIMDPVSGDKISGYGTGNMQIQYGTKIPLKVLGNYAIEKGKYNFSLQKVIFRNFDIQEGSSVAFLGNPYTAELDIRANYTVSANLGDLDQQLLEQRKSARNNIPVNCILQLNGPLNHPGISFDLDLPGATSELNRQVKSYIRTEDMMNRQIVYLLVLSRFYTSPEYVRNESQVNNDLSLLTSTFSTQLSNMLGTISDKFQVGTKFHQSYEGEQTSTEVELLLSSQLFNNRLIINGNFGYIDNPYINNGGSQKNIPLVGDFDLEYKLTTTGEIRLKGFNHYNYRNYYSITPQMTQGFGILFRKDFNRFSDFLWKKSFLPTVIKSTALDTIPSPEKK
jgi:hypothetical protein